jgi:UDP-N-acetylglucosamine transferase subunit ALG13
MIFMTVGTQLAFPRLTEAMNRYAATTDEEIIAQVGDETTDLPNLTVRGMMDPVDFDTTFARARVVVAHAGIGTILSAKRFGRPLIIVPRRHELGEHRNDHQMATARALVGTTGIHIAWEVEDVLSLLQAKTLAGAEQGLGPMHKALVKGIAEFIQGARSADVLKDAGKSRGIEGRYSDIKGAN